jgi:hypothetical protein
MTESQLQDLTQALSKHLDQVVEAQYSQLKSGLRLEVQNEVNAQFTHLFRGELKDRIQSALEERVSIQLNVRVP